MNPLSDDIAAPDYRTVRNIPYRGSAAPEEEACRLDFYHPAGRRNVPVVVWYHGGGLVEGRRSIPAELQQQGIAVAAVDYRLHPAVRAPAYVEDAAAAVAWVFEHAPEHGASPDRIFAAGASAGGWLAALVGLDKRWLAGHGIDADRLAGIVSLSGQAITHFTVRAERGVPQHRVVVDDLAPLHHVRPDAPPLLLVTGDRDLDLPGRYEENALLRRMMIAAGHPATELVELPGRTHPEVEAAAHPYLLKFVRRRTARGPEV